ncbi:uncharacterized protein LOC109068605 [Tachysurus ichikawai]
MTPSEYCNQDQPAEVTIQDDQLGLEPEEEYEEPTVRSQNASYENEQWEPCETCKLEVQALLKKNKMMKDVLSSMNLDHLQPLRDFIDKMEDYKSRESGVLMPQTRPGQQELYPDSGLLLSSTKLAAIHQDVWNGKVPEGKTILDQSKVNGILTYVMSCGKCHGWKPVEKSKLKKALIKKCRMRST